MASVPSASPRPVPGRERNGWLLGPALLILGATGAFGADEDVLDFLAEEAEVVTPSRHAQPELESPVVIDVITREEIEASGAVHLWDLLRYRTGLDVLDGSSLLGNRGIVSIRGAPREVIQEMLVLIDGRSVYAANDGAVYWDTLPVQMQDIERIEIVRGPNAALYGSNAALGVIQILTRKPELKATTEVSGTAGSRDYLLGSAWAEHASPASGIRLSYTHRNEGGQPATGEADLDNGLRADQLNLNTRWSPSAGTELELLAGGAWQDFSVPSAPSAEWKFAQYFGIARLERSVKKGRTLEAKLSWQDLSQESSQFPLSDVDIHERQLEAELLQRLTWSADRLDTTWGLSYRYSEVHSDRIFSGDPQQHNGIARAFLHQSARLAKPITLVAGLALEHSDTGGTEPAYQVTALWQPAPNQTLRLIHALAPTIPSIGDRHRNFQGSATVIAVGNPEAEPEHLRQYEVNYQGYWWRQRLRLGGSLFIMKTEDRLSAVRQPGPPPIRIRPENINSSQHQGAELEIELRPAPGQSVWINYTYLDVTDDIGDLAYLDRTPRNKLNLGGMTDLGRKFMLSAQAGYKDVHTIRSVIRQQAVHVAAGWRLDARFGYQPRPEIELFVSGTNLLQDRHVEFPDGLEVARSFYGGLSWKLGGGP